MTGALYANQPDESSQAGLPDSRILDLAKSVGISSPQFTDAVNTNAFTGWVSTVADDAPKAGVNGTPTVYLNEKQLSLQSLTNASGQFDPALLTQQINAAKG